MHFGIPRQRTSDVQDLFSSPAHSRDLASGARTFPIAWALENVDDPAALERSLDEARDDQGARTVIARRLVEAGALRRTLLERSGERSDFGREPNAKMGRRLAPAVWHERRSWPGECAEAVRHYQAADPL